MIPEDNIIAMENKVVYHYRFLVYTAEPEDWADYGMIQNLKDALKTNYSFVYSNITKWTAEEEVAQSKIKNYFQERHERRRKSYSS